MLLSTLGNNLELNLLNLTVVCYLVSTVAYFVYVAFRIMPIWIIGIGTAIVGCVAQTVALMLRWYAAGLDHPPFTNMYESLVFFAWGIIVVYIVIELIYKVRIAGAFIIPLAFAAMGLASLSPDKSIQPPVPALQSVWLHIHVATASIGYAAFLVAFGFSMLLLFKLRTPFNSVFVAASVVNVYGLLAATKGGALFLKFRLSAVEMVNGVKEKIHIPGTVAPPQFEQINLPVLAAFALIAIGGYVVAAIVCALVKPELTGKASKGARIVFWGATALFSVMLIYMIFEFITNKNIAISANPYAFAMISALWFFSVLFILIDLVHESFLKALPDSRKIDEMAYRSIMVAFPIMTLIIVTGAIWANLAWGRYWGWDPKETASLVTWLIYLLYLHTRITKGWMGKRSAYISIIGFVSVVFTFLGVNLLLSGLHAYATG